jgi:hypothetical protein
MESQTKGCKHFFYFIFVMTIDTIIALMDLRNFDKATENVSVAKVI